MKATLASAVLLLASSVRAAELKLPDSMPASVALASPLAPSAGPAFASLALSPAAPTFLPMAEIPSSLPQSPAASPIPALPAAPALAAAAKPEISAAWRKSPSAIAQAGAMAGPGSAERPAAGLDAGVADGALRFDGAASRHDEAALAAARAATSAEVERLLKLKKRGVKVSKVLAAKDTKTITEYSGVPDRVEALPDDGTVYRHWVRSEADLESILGSSSLRAGPVSYVEFTGSQHAFIKDIYPDLHGVFFTAPDRASSEPRVMNEATPHYVDFRLPRGVRALRLDGKDVMMIPADHGTYIPVELVASSADAGAGR